MQLEAISSCSFPCYLAEETDPHLVITYFHVVLGSNNVLHEPLSRKTLPTPSAACHKICAPGPSPVLLPFFGHSQHLSVHLIVRSPKLNTEFKVWLTRAKYIAAIAVLVLLATLFLRQAWRATWTYAGS